MSIEAMKLALEALAYKNSNLPGELHYEAITALRAAIEQAEKPTPYEETPYMTGVRLFREGKGISFIPTAVQSDDDIGEALHGWEDAKTAVEIASNAAQAEKREVEIEFKEWLYPQMGVVPVDPKTPLILKAVIREEV
jgi:hypothetical protein